MEESSDYQIWMTTPWENVPVDVKKRISARRLAAFRKYKGTLIINNKALLY